MSQGLTMRQMLQMDAPPPGSSANVPQETDLPMGTNKAQPLASTTPDQPLSGLRRLFQ